MIPDVSVITRRYWRFPDMGQFDPYHKWLGIPRDEQPANHYRLLAIALFESDPEVIEAAADRQMKYVSQCAIGEHLKLSQKLLNELSAARVCLLVPDKKQAYDADLNEKLRDSERIEKSMVPIVLTEAQPNDSFPAFEEVAPPARRQSKPKRRSSKVSKSPRTTAESQRYKRFIGIAAAIVACLIVAALGLRSMFAGRESPSSNKPIDPLAVASADTPKPIQAIVANPEPLAASNFNPNPPIAEHREIPRHNRPDVQRKKIPELALQENARRKFNDKHQSELQAARTSKSQAELAKLLVERSETTNDEATRYLMLSEAVTQAATAGDLDLSLLIVQMLTAQFDVDTLTWKERAAISVGSTKRPLSVDEASQLFERFLELSEEALAAEQYGVAVNVMTAAASRFQEPKENALHDDAFFLVSQLTELRDAFAPAKDSRDKLATYPDDPAENLIWGRFVCFYKHDWDTGLALIAKSNDPVWGPLAQQQLNPPTAANDWIALGDAWIEAAANESETVQRLAAQRADHAWQQSLNNVTPLRKKEIQQQVDQRTVELFGESFVSTEGTSDGATLSGSQPFSPTNSFTIEFWVSTTSPIGTLLSKRHVDGEPTMLVHLHNGVPNLSIAIGGGERGSGGGLSINDGKWHHIALVKRSTEINLFVDGSKTVQTTEQTELNSKSPWKFGCSHRRTSCPARFAGIRISKTARYHGPFAPDKRHLRDKDLLLE